MKIIHQEEIILLFYSDRTLLFNQYYYSMLYPEINPQSTTRLSTSIPIKYDKTELFSNYSRISTIVDIGTGVESFFVLDTSWEVFGLGDNNNEFISCRWLHKSVHKYLFFNGSPMRNISKIFCGHYYNIYIDNIGNTYSHGLQINGNLGLNTSKCSIS